MNGCRTCFAQAGISHPYPRAPAQAPVGKPIRKFRDLRVYGHDKKRESQSGNPPSGHKNPELSRLVFFTPGKNKHHKNPSGPET
jgi:hypothetical protein